MISRFRWILIVGTCTLAGCGELFDPGPLQYVDSPRLQADLKDKPPLQEAVRKALGKLYGENPREIKVPVGSGLPLGGARLANYRKFEDGERPQAFLTAADANHPAATVAMRGGFGLYREHCLHCHGVSGAGDGPTAPFLYPRPRDYRKGLFKFTSTATGAKPTRSDLEKTIRYGLHGTSMPAFDAMMSNREFDQVIDYVIFLSLRGETELALIDEAITADDKDPNALSDEVAGEIVKAVANKWKIAATQVMNPPIPKPESTPESVQRGRALFLGLNKTGNKVDCTSCHGPQAVGNGPSFLDQEIFNTVVFGGDPSTRPERLESEADRVARQKFGIASHGSAHEPTAEELKPLVAQVKTKWEESLDDWGEPLRPANLNRGLYKGGRRPIDLYWRVAKGINGAKMPAHYPTLEPERVWDLVNFVLALPYEPKLLEGASLPAAPPASAPKVADTKYELAPRLERGSTTRPRSALGGGTRAESRNANSSESVSVANVSGSGPPPASSTPRGPSKGAFPCVTGVSCSPWPRCSASGPSSMRHSPPIGGSRTRRATRTTSSRSSAKRSTASS